MSKNKFKDEKDFKELMTINNISEIQKFKQEIAGILKYDIKIDAKNDKSFFFRF